MFYTRLIRTLLMNVRRRVSTICCTQVYHRIPHQTTYVSIFFHPCIKLMHDQKPIVALLQLPPRPAEDLPNVPLLTLPATYKPTPDRYANWKRYIGRVFDRIVGFTWWLLILLGAGSFIAGIFNFLVGIGAWMWWHSRPSVPDGSV